MKEGHRNDPKQVLSDKWSHVYIQGESDYKLGHIGIQSSS